MAAMITDYFIVALLIGGIVYGVVVSRRVQRLMATLAEMEPLVREFSEAVDKSEASVTGMRKNLEQEAVATATQAEPVPEQEPGQDADPKPAFRTRRFKPGRISGVRVIRDKQDLVRRFFETSRSEKRA